MKKSFIRLNNNDDQLSLGNLFRIIKELAQNKTAASQTELFCILFNIKEINETTVNNYCIGLRKIGDNYKQRFVNKEKKYRKNNLEFIDNILNILSVIDAKIYQNKDINFINNNTSAKLLLTKLYEIAKNDNQINQEFLELVKNKDTYNGLCEIIIYIVLYKKQPLYEEDLKKEVLNNVLKDTSISAKSLQEYLSLKLKEGINYDYSMKKLALNGNAYANYELGANEFYGYVCGYPRYYKAIEYLEKAAELNHAGACYLIGRIYIEELVGKKNEYLLTLGYNYLKKAEELGNIAATNMLGNMCYDGTYPCKKDLNKAIQYYTKASKENYVYAYNNLAKIEEQNGNLEKAYELYKQSASLGESWACNKMGEYYCNNNELDNAFKYYNKALESNYHVVCNYAYYNLAKYFYLYGSKNVEKDTNKAIDYLNIAIEHNIIEALIELLIYKIENNDDYNEIIEIKKKIENHEKYSEEIKQHVEKLVKNIKKIKPININ